MKQLLFLLILLLLIPAGIAAGQSSSDNFTVQRFVTVAGGSAESSSFNATSAIGQPATSLTSSSSFDLSSGFLLPEIAGVPTAVDVSTTATTSLTPFWLLVASACILLLLALLLHRRTVN